MLRAARPAAQTRTLMQMLPPHRSHSARFGGRRIALWLLIVLLLSPVVVVVPLLSGRPAGHGLPTRS